MPGGMTREQMIAEVKAKRAREAAAPRPTVELPEQQVTADPSVTMTRDEMITAVREKRAAEVANAAERQAAYNNPRTSIQPTEGEAGYESFYDGITAGHLPDIAGWAHNKADQAQALVGDGMISDAIQAAQYGHLGERADQLEQSGPEAYADAQREKLDASAEEQATASMVGRGVGGAVGGTLATVAGGVLGGPVGAVAGSGAFGGTDTYKQTGDAEAALTSGAVDAAVTGLTMGAGKALKSAGKFERGRIGGPKIPQEQLGLFGGATAKPPKNLGYGPETRKEAAGKVAAAAAEWAGGGGAKGALKRMGAQGTGALAGGLLDFGSGGVVGGALAGQATGAAIGGMKQAAKSAYGAYGPEAMKAAGEALQHGAPAAGQAAAGMADQWQEPPRQSPTDRIRQHLKDKQHRAGLEALRKAFVRGKVPPQYAEQLGEAVQSGDSKRLAARLQELQRDPGFASYYRNLAKGGKK